MRTNYIVEYESQLQKDKENNVSGFYDGGRATLLKFRIEELEVKIANKMFEICVGYGVLPDPRSVYRYQQLVLRGDMTYTNAMKQFKKALYNC